jgi:hypothetical protein
MMNFLDFMLLRGPRNPLTICLHDWEGYGCVEYATSGLGRSTGYNNKTNYLIAFCDVSCCFVNMSQRSRMCLLPFQGRTRAV